LGDEFRHVVGEDYGIVAGARGGNLGKARVEQVRADAGLGVNYDALGGKALRAVASDGIAVAEVSMLPSIQFNPAIIAQASDHPAIGMDRFDDVQALRPLHAEVAEAGCRTRVPGTDLWSPFGEGIEGV
jgi:hypothetical protein